MKAAALQIIREAEKVQLSALITSDVSQDRWSPLDGVPAPEWIPPVWIGPHVGLRLIGAFKTLARLAVGRLQPAEKSGYWPAYHHDWADLVAQRAAEAADIELQEYLANRSRVMPSAQDVSRMEAVIVWPARYLRGRPIIMRAVQNVAVLRARELEMGSIARRLRLDPSYLRHANRAGLDVIAAGLRGERVGVF